MSGHITHPQSWVYFHTKTLAILPNKGCHICRESWVTQAASARDLLLCCWMQRWWGCGRSSSLTPSEAKEADVEASSGWFMSRLVLMEQLCGLRTKCVLSHAQGISSNLLGDIRFLRSSSKLWAAPTAPLGPYCLCNKEGISGKSEVRKQDSVLQGGLRTAHSNQSPGWRTSATSSSLSILGEGICSLLGYVGWNGHTDIIFDIRNVKIMAEEREHQLDHHTAQETEKTEEPVFFPLTHWKG